MASDKEPSGLEKAQEWEAQKNPPQSVESREGDQTNRVNQQQVDVSELVEKLAATHERNQRRDSIEVVSKGTVDIAFHLLEVIIGLSSVFIAALAVIFGGINLFIAITSVFGTILGTITLLESMRLLLLKTDKYIIYPLHMYRQFIQNLMDDGFKKRD